MENRIISIVLCKVRGKAILLQAWTGSEFSSGMRLSDYNNQQMKVIIMSALGIRHLFPPRNIPGTHSCLRQILPQLHSSGGRNVALKIFNDTTGNRTRDLPVYSADLQPTAPTRAACSSL